MQFSTFSGARALLALAAALCLASAQAAPAAGTWVASWGAAPDSDGPALRDQTVRQLLRISAGGKRVRVRLSNAYGSGPLVIGPVRLARSTGDGTIRPGSERLLLFHGRPTVTIAKGGDALSDPVGLAVGALDELALSIYVKDTAGPSTLHGDARQDARLAGGDTTGKPLPAQAGTDASRYFVNEVLVEAAPGARAIVIVGDSISDGNQSTPNRNARWPDVLASRLQADPALASIAVVNAGISGNRLLNDGPVGPSMLQRLGRDALGRAGVRWIVLEAGLNDIGLADDAASPADAVSAADIIAGMRLVVARAHAHGIAVWGATLTPYGGAEQPLRHSAAAETRRQAVNAWIRSAGSVDQVLDFDAAIRDPRQVVRMLPALDSGDHVHPNDAGYRVLADAVPLRWFSAAAPAASPRR